MREKRACSSLTGACCTRSILCLLSLPYALPSLPIPRAGTETPALERRDAASWFTYPSEYASDGDAAEYAGDGGEGDVDGMELVRGGSRGGRRGGASGLGSV